MKTYSAIAKEQSILEIFTEMMDQIYYEGYTEDLITSDPEKFDWELKAFQALFSRKSR